MKKLRVFISSPGDVQQERLIAKKVIANLNKIYSQYVELETVMWEDLPLEATASFQDGIDYFLGKSPIDIAVFILWSRLGSKLGQNFKKPDGTEYHSGTEYEFDMMYALWERTKRPKIMVYVKDAEPQFSGGLNLSDIKEALEQRNLLQHFIEENFKDKTTGTNYAYWQFDKQHAFEDRLNTHLTRLIHEQLEEGVCVKEWEGNPYVGLRSYEETEANIFCGRQSLIYDIAEHWIQQTDSFTQKPLLILGESGSGKSSLVKAGLIPYLHNMSTEKQTYRVQTMIPSEFRGNVYQGIVKQLMEAFPQLKNNPVEADLNKGIPVDYDFKYLQFALTNTPNDDVAVFFFDQFEELFNDSLITEDETKRALQLLHGLCSMPHLWLIISMRNDFYSRFTTFPEFGALKNEACVVDIPNVSTTDIADIVEIPAKRANLTWEVNDHGVSLSKIIAQEANELKDLPLIEFGLSELYSSKIGDKLTFAAYEEMGRLKGAVAKYADRCYESLSKTEKKNFEKLLGAVITVSSQDENKFVRKTSLLKDVAKSKEESLLVKKLTDAHLFVTGKDANGEPTITIVHEMLFSSWGVITNWIESQKEFIRKNNYYESLAKVWDANNRKDRNLIQERTLLLDCEYYLYRYEDHATMIMRDFLLKSLKRDRRKGLVKSVFGFVIFSFLILGLFLGFRHGTFGVDSFDDLFDFNNRWYYYLLVIPLWVMTLHAIIIRILGKPKYKTIRFTALLSFILSICYIVNIISDIINDEFFVRLMIYIPLLIAELYILNDFHRRNLWKKGVFKPYLLKDKSDKIRDGLIWLLIGFVFIFTMGYYAYELNEKNNKFKDTLAISDDLFAGLNDMRSYFSPQDNLYINHLWQNYLISRFSDSLSMNGYNKRKEQYAISSYNLYYDSKVILRYLSPKDYPRHRILYIKALMNSGQFKDAEHYLEEFVADNRHDKYFDDSWASTGDLVWIAEKLGRFDIAEELFEILKRSGVDIASNSGMLVNYGHIQLMRGNLKESLSLYQKAEIVGITDDMSECIIQDWHKYLLGMISSDFSIFNWLGVGNGEMIEKASSELQISPKNNFHTSVSDSIFTMTTQKKLSGIWALADSTIMLDVDSTSNVCRYRYYNYNNEINRQVTFCRFSNKDGIWYWEELNQDNDMLSFGEITDLKDSTFSVKIIDNGNESDKGKTRVYYRYRVRE